MQTRAPRENLFFTITDHMGNTPVKEGAQPKPSIVKKNPFSSDEDQVKIKNIFASLSDVHDQQKQQERSMSFDSFAKYFNFGNPLTSRLFFRCVDTTNNAKC